jgi:hypothetical protein
MTSENAAGGGPAAPSDPPAAYRPAPTTPVPPGAIPTTVDWDADPAGGLDPEDAGTGRSDNLARLLDDIPPHHIDH